MKIKWLILHNWLKMSMNNMIQFDPQNRPLIMAKSSELPINTGFFIIEWE